MAVSTSRFILDFRSRGLSSLVTTRSVIRGIQDQSYISLNNASRSFSMFERTANKSLKSINQNLRLLTGGLLGFGAIRFGAGGLVSSLMLLKRAFIDTNTHLQSSKIMLEELFGNENKATSFINVMKGLSADFGADMSETFKASRGLVQVLKQNTTAQKPLEAKHLDKMMKMVMAVSAMDLENRGLAYTAFSFKEAMTGQGRVDFRSLKNRLEINLGRETETAITKAIKNQDIDKAITLFDEGLKRIGIDSEKILRRLSTEGFLQNMNRLTAYMKRTFQLIGEKAFYAITKPFARFNDFLARNFKDGGTGLKILQEMGDTFAGAMNPYLKTMKEFGNRLYESRELVVNGMRGAIFATGRAIIDFKNIFVSFFSGLSDKDGVGKIIGLFKGIESTGKFLSKIFKSLHEPINMIGKAVGNLTFQIKAFLSNLGISGGDLAKVISGGIAVATTPFEAYNKMVGNTKPTDSSGNQAVGQASKFSTILNTAITGLSIYALMRGMRTPKIGAGGSATVSGAGAGTSVGASEVARSGVRPYTPLGDMMFNRTTAMGQLNYKTKAEISRLVKQDAIFQQQALKAEQARVNIAKAMEKAQGATSKFSKQIYLAKAEQAKRQLSMSQAVMRDRMNNVSSPYLENMRREQQRLSGSSPALGDLIDRVKNASSTDIMTGSILFMSLAPLLKGTFSFIFSFIKNAFINVFKAVPFKLTTLGWGALITATAVLVSKFMTLDDVLSKIPFVNRFFKSENEKITDNEIENSKNRTTIAGGLITRRLFKEMNINQVELAHFLNNAVMYNKKTGLGKPISSPQQMGALMGLFGDKKINSKLQKLSTYIQSGEINPEEFNRMMGRDDASSLFAKDSFALAMDVKAQIAGFAPDVRKSIVDDMAKAVVERMNEEFINGKEVAVKIDADMTRSILMNGMSNIPDKER